MLEQKCLQGYLPIFSQRTSEKLREKTGKFNRIKGQGKLNLVKIYIQL